MNVRVFSPGLVDDVDAINEDIFETSSEIWYGRQVRQIWLYYSSYIHLNEEYLDTTITSKHHHTVTEAHVPIFNI